MTFARHFATALTITHENRTKTLELVDKPAVVIQVVHIPRFFARRRRAAKLAELNWPPDLPV
jgi:hypothetical protein